jgi:hypothetical protein
MSLLYFFYVLISFVFCFFCFVVSCFFFLKKQKKTESKKSCEKKIAQWLWVEDIWEWVSTMVMGGGYLGMG